MGNLILEIVKIFKLGAPCVLRRFGPVVFFLIGGYNPHLGGRSRFTAERWTARVTQPARFTPLWPASWLSAVDKTRNSKSAEVRRVWEIFDERLQVVPAEDVLRLDGALLDGDVSRARLIWSYAAEEALADAYRLAGGPDPGHGVKLGRGPCSIFCG